MSAKSASSLSLAANKAHREHLYPPNIARQSNVERQSENAERMLIILSSIGFLTCSSKLRIGNTRYSMLVYQKD